jgi:hypothetical protein
MGRTNKETAMQTRSASLYALFLLLCLAALPVAATTYVMVSDEDLADQAQLIVSGQVAAVGAAAVGAAPTTDYLLAVDRVLKGEALDRIVVRVPGGRAAGDRFLKVWGAPELSLGERVLLFLAPRADGTYAPLHLMLGAFHETRMGDKTLAARDLEEAQALEGGAKEDALRGFAPFAEWLADRAQGLLRSPDYELGATAALRKSLEQKFVLNRLSDGVPLRWFAFDRGSRVNWQVNDPGQPGLSLDDTITSFQAGLAAWSSVAGTNVRYSYAGTTHDSAGLRRMSGANSILFNDPNGDIGNAFDCIHGGIAAIAGVWAEAGTYTFAGTAYHSLVESHIVVNDGTECLFRDNPSVAAEVFGHELGHSLGLGHSAERDALMTPVAHNDGRGARLAADDLAGIFSLYGDGSAPPPPPPGPPAPVPSSSAPAAPSSLVANGVAKGAVTLVWKANAGDSTEFHIERKVGKAYQEIMVCPGGELDAELHGQPAGRQTYRVRARNTAGFSPYSKALAVKIPK